jgi:type IV secretion system protein VirD4
VRCGWRSSIGEIKLSDYILGRSIAPARAIGFAARASVKAGSLITYAGDGHLITLAPTGAGKSVGPVICNALTHPGQLVVLDMKGEVYAATAETRRGMGQEVHVLDLRDNRPSDSLNPLDLVARNGAEPAVMARSFAAEFIERGGDERDRFWNDSAETLLSGGVAWLLADRPAGERRISALFDLFNADDVTYSIAVILDKKEVRNRSAKAAFCSFLQLPDRETRPSVLGTLHTHIRLFDSDLVRRLTDTTTIDLDAFIAGRPMSLYVIVPPQKLSAYRPLLRVWLSGLMLALTQRQHPPQERTLMLCDEVGNLGRLDVLLMPQHSCAPVASLYGRSGRMQRSFPCTPSRQTPSLTMPG